MHLVVRGEVEPDDVAGTGDAERTRVHRPDGIDGDERLVLSAARDPGGERQERGEGNGGDSR